MLSASGASGSADEAGNGGRQCAAAAGSTPPACGRGLAVPSAKLEPMACDPELRAVKSPAVRTWYWLPHRPGPQVCLQQRPKQP